MINWWWWWWWSRWLIWILWWWRQCWGDSSRWISFSGTHDHCASASVLFKLWSNNFITHVDAPLSLLYHWQLSAMVSCKSSVNQGYAWWILLLLLNVSYVDVNPCTTMNEPWWVQSQLYHQYGYEFHSRTEWRSYPSMTEWCSTHIYYKMLAVVRHINRCAYTNAINKLKNHHQWYCSNRHWCESTIRWFVLQSTSVNLLTSRRHVVSSTRWIRHCHCVYCTVLQ